MHQCLSCNQPCSLISAFCDTCRASLLAKREQMAPEEQTEAARVNGGPTNEGGYSIWEMGEGMANVAALPQPEAALVGAQAEQSSLASASTIEGEPGAWSFETSGVHSMETVNDCAREGQREENAEGAQATHVLAVPPRPRRNMPRNVKRALLVFCIVGALALVTDSILLALSITRHHATENVAQSQPGIAAQQEGISPATGTFVLTPTGTTQSDVVAPLALSLQHLAFSAIEGQGSIAPQTITLASSPQGFSWQIAQPYSLPAWIHFSSEQASVAANATGALTVSARPAGLGPGTYTTTVQIKATDAQGHALANSPATLAVSLSIRPPCTLSVTPTKLSFDAVLLSAPSPQTLTLSENANCVFPISWQVSSDASWITFSRSSGTESAAGGTIIVQASSAGKLIGSYTTHITFQGTDGVGVPLVIVPNTISATLTVLASGL